MAENDWMVGGLTPEQIHTAKAVFELFGDTPCINNAIEPAIEAAFVAGRNYVDAKVVPKAVAENTKLKKHNATLAEILTRMTGAMEAYEMAVDEDPPYRHRQMMRDAKRVLKS